MNHGPSELSLCKTLRYYSGSFDQQIASVAADYEVSKKSVGAETGEARVSSREAVGA